jgi:hypothetical protein
LDETQTCWRQETLQRVISRFVDQRIFFDELVARAERSRRN